MFNKILLFILRNRLNRYKKNNEWYHSMVAEPNWYDEYGIPELEEKIAEVENKIKKEDDI